MGVAVPKERPSRAPEPIISAIMVSA